MKQYLIWLIIWLIIRFTNQPTAFGQLTTDQAPARPPLDSLRKATFYPFPILSVAPETGLQYGAYGLYSFFADQVDPSIRNSTASLTALRTTQRQTILRLTGDVWSKANTYHYVGDVGYRNFPFFFYGIGSNTRVANAELLIENRLSAHLSVERRLVGPYYVGLRLGYDGYRYRADQPGGIAWRDPDLKGRSGGQLVYGELLQIIDSRDNNVYPTRGSFAKLSAGYAPDWFEGDDYTGGLFNADLRTFRSVTKQLVLGAQAVYQTYTASSVPFYLLPQLGSDQVMRGYYAGRFRDQSLSAFQAELRYRLLPTVGVVVFGGGGTTYGLIRFSARSLKPNYGLGVRYFFDPKRGLSLRLDYGLGEKPPGERRVGGFYFSLGEAF